MSDLSRQIAGAFLLERNIAPELQKALLTGQNNFCDILVETLDLLPSTAHQTKLYGVVCTHIFPKDIMAAAVVKWALQSKKSLAGIAPKKELFDALAHEMFLKIPLQQILNVVHLNNQEQTEIVLERRRKQVYNEYHIHPFILFPAFLSQRVIQNALLDDIPFVPDINHIIEWGAACDKPFAWEAANKVFLEGFSGVCLFSLESFDDTARKQAPDILREVTRQQMLRELPIHKKHSHEKKM